MGQWYIGKNSYFILPAPQAVSSSASLAIERSHVIPSCSAESSALPIVNVPLPLYLYVQYFLPERQGQLKLYTTLGHGMVMV